jgi:branched-chain amino acid transport system permease protein
MAAMIAPGALRGYERAASTALLLSLLVIAGALLAVLLFGASGRRIATLACISTIMAVGLVSFSGNTGIVSFGHAAFAGIGAYASAIATMPAGLQKVALPLLPPVIAGFEWPFAGGLVAAGVLGAAVGAVAGLPVARMKGSSASITTLGCLIIIYTVLSGARDFTRGNQTFYGVPRVVTLEIAVGLAVALICVALIFKESKAGLFARAQRDDEAAALAVGIGPFRARHLPWILSTAICAVGGALYGHYLGAFSPRSFYFDLTFSLVAMVILGGIGGVTGAVVGVFSATIILETLRQVETGIVIAGIPTPPILGIGSMGLGLALMLILMLRPKGLTGGREWALPLPAMVRRLPAKFDAPYAASEARDLSVLNVAKRYAGVVAVDDVSCRIAAGRITGLIGPNGAGKTTLINVITGHVQPSAGSIKLGADEIAGHGAVALARRGIARTFQNIRVFSELTVLDNVVVAALAAGCARAEAFGAAIAELDALDLTALADQRAGALAYGPRRRLEIARALAQRPRLLILDEPAAGMNPAETDDLKRRLGEIAAGRGIAVLLIDHDLPFVLGLSQDLIVLDRGRVIAAGPPESVRTDPRVIEAYIGAPAAA